jgi:hypothetical protein
MNALAIWGPMFLAVLASLIDAPIDAPAISGRLE